VDGEWAEGVSQNFVGVDRERLVSDPDRYRGELFKGPHFKKLSVPSTVAGGSGVTVKGVVHLDNAGVQLLGRKVRVIVDGPSLDQERVFTTDKLTHCNTRSFSIDVPVTGDPGQTMALSVKAQSNVYGNWATGEQKGPFRINIQTETQQRAQDAAGYAPWAVGGAGVGMLVARATGSEESLTPMAGGAAVGAAGKIAWDRSGGWTFTLPTTEIAVVGGALLAATMFLNSTGASDVLQPAGELAGSSFSSAREAIARRRS
jgi:hypothetical protein